LYIGLPNTIANRKAAEIKAQPIELDMTSGNFDRSLAKYKPQAQSEAISVVEMFDRFTQQKQRTISIGGWAKYLSLAKILGLKPLLQWPALISTNCKGLLKIQICERSFS
jgi:integrase